MAQHGIVFERTEAALCMNWSSRPIDSPSSLCNFAKHFRATGVVNFLRFLKLRRGQNHP